jgi:hypothetical protein
MRLKRWVTISLFNLLLVAFLGVLLRYKIAFPLPFVEQKYILHAHSHFAFSGWITQALMTLLVNYLIQHSNEDIYKKYKWILHANLATAYGMLFTFPFEGYALLSIIFSTLSIFVSYIFSFVYWKDLNKIFPSSIAHNWFKAAVLFNAISSIGAFSLAYMMATKTANEGGYLSAVYWFLHFQYNGWFFFACVGLFHVWLDEHHVRLAAEQLMFWLFAAACVPAYFLSVLWLPMSKLEYFIVVASAVAPVIAWIFLLKNTGKIFSTFKNRNVAGKYLLALSAVACSIKLILQLGSTVPSLNQITFGFRPIVIGYLHLVLLGVITLFILGFLYINEFIYYNSLLKKGTVVFTSGIIVNEIFLMIQGSAALEYQSVPWINEMLFAAGLIMLCGILLIVLSQHKTRAKQVLKTKKVELYNYEYGHNNTK